MRKAGTIETKAILNSKQGFIRKNPLRNFKTKYIRRRITLDTSMTSIYNPDHSETAEPSLAPLDGFFRM